MMVILMVEDVALERSRLERLIHEALPGAVLHAFGDSIDALEAIQKGHCLPDIAFLDVELPALSGIELAQKLLALKPDTNIIFTTAYTNYMQAAFNLFASGYLLKPVTLEQIQKQLDHLRFPVADKACRFRAKTAGSFEFFCDGMPVAFSMLRAKEMLAYLIDRQGASVTKREIFSVLFEDAPYTNARQDYMKKIIRALRGSLAAVGGEDILIHMHNSYAVNTSLFSCDLYEARRTHTEEKIFRQAGYMEQYSWAEERWV